MLGYHDIKDVIEAVSKKYPNIPKDDLNEVINNFSVVTKTYRVIRAELRSVIPGAQAEREIQKDFKEITKSFKRFQQFLSAADINMDDEGHINGIWVRGKI